MLKKHYNIPTSGTVTCYISFPKVMFIDGRSESPSPKHPDLFGSFPSAAAGEKYTQFTLSVDLDANLVLDDANRLIAPQRQLELQIISY